MTQLFKMPKTSKPLADEIRPTTIGEIFGQEHLFADNSQIMQMINSGHIQNIILWGHLVAVKQQ